MESIQFYAGQESGVIIEKENFSQSVFSEKYQHTFEIFSRIWQSPNNDISNIIAICGDRGEGKTSLLKTIQNILRADEKAFDKAKEVFHLPNGFKQSKVRVLDIIDPAFFDAKHNLIELLLGKMYGELRDQIKQDKDSILSVDKTKLLQQFDKVKNCLSIIRKHSDDSIYDKLEELDKLAAGMQLKEELDELFKLYAQHFSAERMVICIDDLDLNMSEGYQMAEEMRKYLCNSKRCIILVALKVEQMNEVIASYLRENTNNEIIDKDSVFEMANHYITKLLPLSHRVWMPSGSEIAEREVIIIDREGKEHKYTSVKEAVVWLIFQKTRYIFVNGRATSPIVPTNMRNLRHLLGTLLDMPPAKDNENRDNVENKRIFKQYFFHKWIECLSSKDYEFVSDLVKINDYSLINKSVVTHLAYKFPKEQVAKKENEKGAPEPAKNDTPADMLLRNILDFRNTMYNISIGDVFYVMQRLDQIPININTSNLIFFIRSFYAIKLYETYDIISLDNQHLFMDEKVESPSIYKYDLALQQQNMMQRLINGSYFTYLPGELLPAERNRKPRDIRYIGTKNLRKLLQKVYEMRSIKSSLSTMTESEKKQYYSLFHLAEFFALTTVFAVEKKETDVSFFCNRRSPNPIMLNNPDSDHPYLIFDVLSVFYNIINQKKAYEKFANYYPDFYQDAETLDDSLLNKMRKSCPKEENVLRESNLNINIHGLISDVAIRSDSVLMAVLDVSKINRNQNNMKKGSALEKIGLLYKAIQNLDIRLYPKEEGDNVSRYNIPFKFINAFSEIIEKSIDRKQFELVYMSEDPDDTQLDIDYEQNN